MVDELHKQLELERARVMQAEDQLADARKQLQNHPGQLQKGETDPVKRIDYKLEEEHGVQYEPFVKVDFDTSELKEAESVCGEPFELLVTDKTTESTLGEKDKKTCNLQKQLDASLADIAKKEKQLVNLERQLDEARAAASEIGKVKDHSKVQSRTMLKVKQELDATKVLY